MKILLLCTKCKEQKEDIFFYKDKSKPQGYHTNCKLCHSTRNKIKRKTDLIWRDNACLKSKKYRKENPQKYRDSIKDATYRSKYNITLEWVLTTVHEQKVCPICNCNLIIGGKNTKQTAVVDHCHTTGKVRGIICHRCNVGLGCFNDNPILINKAQEYLLSKSYF